MFGQGTSNYRYPLRRNEDRKATDVCCFVSYLLLTFLLLGAFFYSFILEKEKNLLIPEDPDGRRCGYGQAKDYPFIYFPSPFIESIENSVCVASCPTDENSKIDCLTNSKVPKCEYDMTNHFDRTKQFIVYSTTKNDFLRLCKPSSTILLSSLNSKINTYSLFANFQRVFEARNIIMIVCPVVCLSLIIVYLIILHCLNDIVYLVWAVFIMFSIITIFVGSYLLTPTAKKIFAYSSIVGIIILIIAVGLILYVIYNRSRIHQTIQLLNLASIYIKQNPLLILISLGSFIVWALIFALELVVFVSIFSINEGTGTGKSENSFAFFTSINNNFFTNFLLAMVVLHYIWTNLLIYHTAKYLTKALASNWVLRIENPFKIAVYSMLRFHTGTVVYGSLVLTFLGWITDFFYFIMPDRTSQLCCCTCTRLLQFYQQDCFKRFLGFFTQLTYIGVNLNGEDFCEAGEKLTPILVNNLVYVNKAYRMASILTFTSKVLIAFLTTLICYAVLQLQPELTGHIITNIIIFIFSFLLTDFATDSYDRSFETILFTIIMNKDHKKNLDNRSIIHESIFENLQNPAKKQVYDKVEAWFDHQVKEDEKRSNDSS